MPLQLSQGIASHGDDRAVLRLYPGFKGALRVHLASGVIASIALLPRESMVLLALLIAYLEDPTEPDEGQFALEDDFRRGRIAARQLASVYLDLRIVSKDPSDTRPVPNEVSETAVRTYISDVRRKVREELARFRAGKYDAPDLEVVSTDAGYRIGRQGLEIRGLENFRDFQARLARRRGWTDGSLP